ncbi:MAG: hypothetical protein ACE5JU_09855 [Candidatus Binatia bacterium]
MNSISESAYRHIEHLEGLAEALRKDGIAVLEHSYHALAFGSFVLVVGRPMKRLKFSWDGKEFFLDVFYAEGDSSAVIPKWEHRENKRLGAIDNDELFRMIEDMSRREFSV